MVPNIFIIFKLNTVKMLVVLMLYSKKIYVHIFVYNHSKSKSLVATKFGRRLCLLAFHHFGFNPGQLLYVFTIRAHGVVGVLSYKCVSLISTSMEQILRYKILYRFTFSYFWTTTRWHGYAWLSASVNMDMRKELLKITACIFWQ